MHTSARRFGEHLVVVRRLMNANRRRIHTLIGSRYGCPYTGIANQIPPDEVCIPAVVRITKRALNGVGPYHLEERRGAAAAKTGSGSTFNLAEKRVLGGCGELVKRPATG